MYLQFNIRWGQIADFERTKFVHQKFRYLVVLSMETLSSRSTTGLRYSVKNCVLQVSLCQTAFNWIIHFNVHSLWMGMVYKQSCPYSYFIVYLYLNVWWWINFPNRNHSELMSPGICEHRDLHKSIWEFDALCSSATCWHLCEGNINDGWRIKRKKVFECVREIIFLIVLIISDAAWGSSNDSSSCAIQRSRTSIRYRKPVV